MLEPKAYTIHVTIRTEMWLHEPVVYRADGWVNPDFADTVIRSLNDDFMHGFIKPADVTHIDIKEITYAQG